MDIESLRRLAELSRLDCTPAELEALLPDMEDVLSLMDKIRKFPDLPEETKASLSLDALREDKPWRPDNQGKESEDGETAASQSFWTPRIV
ncbi:MAG: aspartyl/glutamyl-tRNA amidotransferase subunit C [Clostridiales bacterium]|nr:aspartyl/glutamyl-tRNA amidotransferase subunit C [Clostridiales bacterium]